MQPIKVRTKNNAGKPKTEGLWVETVVVPIIEDGRVIGGRILAIVIDDVGKYVAPHEIKNILAV